jgi:predicted metalloprotease with PDZ domain
MDDQRINNVSDPRMSEVNKFISTKRAGDKIKVLINRDGELLTLDVTLERNPNHKFKILSLDGATAKQNAVKKRWLHL